jgi:valyl-tRNA synthetase
LEVCDDNADCIGTFDLTSATPGILGSLNPATHTVSYYVLQASAEAGVNPITNLLAFNNSTPCAQTIWVSISDNVTGCADVIPLDLIVNPLPLAPSPAVSPYTLCDYTNPGDEVEVFDLSTKIPEILMGQTGISVSFYFSLADAQAGVNPLPMLYTNVANAQTLFVVLGNDDTACSVITTMDLRVEPLPAPVPPAGPVVECDPDGDGFAQFDLAALTLDLLQGAPGVDINYYETEQDAMDGTNAIDSTVPYTNITPLVQFIWVGAENTAVPQCRSTLMIELNVIPSPNVPILADLTICDQDANAQDGFAAFDLTVQTPVVLAAQAGAPGSYVVGYFLTQADAQAGTSPIIPADNYVNVSNPQTIWVGIHDVNNECYDTGSFEINVNTPLALITPAPLSLCDDGPTTAIPQMVFDLSVKNDEITQGLPGYTVTYFPSYGDAIAGTNAISPSEQLAYTNLTNPQTLGVMVTSGDGCVSYTTLDIRVLPLPNPQANAPALEVCDNILPQGTEIFDLTLNEDYFSNGDPNLTYAYYATEQDAQNQVNPIANAAAYEGSGTVWVVVTNNQVPFSGPNCSAITSMELIVNPLPEVAATPVPYVLCDTTGAGTGIFVLSSQDSNVLLAPQNMADFTITYHLTLADAQAGVNPLPNNYTNVSNPQDIYASVVNDITECVNSTAVVTLSVAAGATSASPATGASSCAADLTGEAVFDLTLFNTEVLNGQDPAQFTVSYYPTLADAQDNTNMIVNPAAYSTASATLYGVVTNTATQCRSTPAPISINVDPLADPAIISDNGNVLCVNWGETTPQTPITLTTDLGPGYTFQWYLNGAQITGATNPSFTIDTASGGDYTVVVTNTVTGCVSPASQPFNVILSGAPQIAMGTPGFTINNYFAEDQVITITVAGNGHYLYSMDGGPFLDNGGVFSGVGAGEHNVIVRDENGCGEIPVGPIQAINYPHYFTPNGDGIHDTWNIIGLQGQPGARIHIFDRYGKLIKQISPQGTGWDGTYNGQPLPSTDYWFTVLYTETGAEREFRAHFSLKR